MDRSVIKALNGAAFVVFFLIGLLFQLGETLAAPCVKFISWKVLYNECDKCRHTTVQTINGAGTKTARYKIGPDQEEKINPPFAAFTGNAMGSSASIRVIGERACK